MAKKKNPRKTTVRLPFYQAEIARLDEQFISNKQAKLFLKAIDKYFYDFRSLPEIPKSKEPLQQIVSGLVWRYMMFYFDCENREAEDACSRDSKGRRLKQGNIESGRVHSEHKKQQALKLFKSLTGKRKLVKEANAAVAKQFDVPARTLREWRRKNKSAAMH